MSHLIGNHSAIVYDAKQETWLLFQHPIALYSTHQMQQVVGMLRDVETQAQTMALWAVGWVSYEASPAFDPTLVVKSSDFPLLWFGLYSAPEPITLNCLPPPSLTAPPWEPSLAPVEYHQAIAQIKHQIRQGNTYQVNYTYRLRSQGWEPLALFRQLIDAQPGHYGALIQTPEWSLCCASPELFFSQDGNELVSRPMKGTMPRGLADEGDRGNARQLQDSEKNRAENVMIVDMVRNDMARIADLGSVQVTSLFEIEQYPTVWQMTSTVRCTTQAGMAEIFGALFPPASITGAPKARTMQIIAELETTPRKIYTGTIGFIAPQRRSQFNVAIRTVLIDSQTQQAEYGVGGGIVWDSTVASELAESRTKARILTQASPMFSLLESLRWTPEEGFFLLDQHLQRLGRSARYFAYSIDLEALRYQLLTATQPLAAQPHKIQLQVSKTGVPTIDIQPLPIQPQPYRVSLASHPIDSSNPYLYHKTTYRPMYAEALQTAAGYDDVVLWNERGEITESCIANVVVERDGEWVTPPVHCGLLAGTHRSLLLEQGKICEQVIRVEELSRCTQILLINSVRQLWNITSAFRAEG